MRPAPSAASSERTNDSITTRYPGQQSLEYPLPPRPPDVEVSDVMEPEEVVSEKMNEDNEDRSDWLIEFS